MLEPKTTTGFVKEQDRLISEEKIHMKEISMWAVL